MTTALTIEQANSNAAEYAINRAAIEGWNPGLDDTITFTQADPNGFFLAKLNDRTIGCASCICYDKRYAFFGLYVIENEYRGKGYGMQLTHHRLKYAENRCTGLDGVLENEKMYTKIGFKTAYISHRYIIKPQTYCSLDLPNVKPIDPNNINAIINYDRLAFPAPRQSFLRAWLSVQHQKAFYISTKEGVKGYAVIRQCLQGYKIGPLFADNADYAKQLLDTCLNTANDMVYIDIPEINQAAIKLIANYNSSTEFSCARMYRNGSPDHDTQRVFGLTSYELG